MQYPLISEYIESIRSAEDNFEKLNNLRPVLDANGNPVMSSGNFAVVFKMKDIETGKMYAVKCFTREQEERKERYREIIKVLGHLNSPYFVSAQYYDKELFVDTSQDDETEYPVLVMDWVEGTCLDEYILTIKDDKAKRELLSNKFQEFVSWLLPKHFAHGDIKPDNIVVKDDGNVMLVDYDGMFVPSLYGKPALEFGTPMFRYKNRTLEDFNEYIDDYATVFILLVLKVSVTYPTIIDDFVNREPQFDIVKRIVTFMNDKQIAPIISAYIMVANYGHLDRQLIPSLIANRANFNLSKETKLLYSARQGNTRDMIELAELYEKGESVAKNIDKAMKWYNLALNLGDANAACSLCLRLRNDPDELFNDNDVLFEKLYQSGCNFAYCRKGECSNSKEYLQLAADRGFAPALYNLGKRYELLFKDKDKNKAIEYYTKAAEQGYTVAMHALRRLYKENAVESIKWLKKLAYYGDTKEQCELGLEYYKGIIINKNISKAIYWLNKAASKGDETAMFYLGEIYDQVEDYQDICKAVYWYRKAAEAGDSDAQLNLAFCYDEGHGVEQDFSKAVYWYQKAAEAGNSRAEQALNITCKLNKIYDVLNVKDGEISHVGECNTGLYSADGKRFLCYFGTYGYDYQINEGTEFLCDDSFNDLYSECDGHCLSILYLPKSLKRIGDYVFCASIDHISCESPNFKVKEGFLLSHDEKILYRYFGDNSIVQIPKGINYIKGGAFSGKDIERIILPLNIFMYIGDNPFAGCNNLREIVTHGRYQVINKTLYDNFENRLIGCWNYDALTIFIQSGTKRIGKNAFFGLNVQYIELPDSIVEIDETAFYRCLNVKTISIPTKHYKRIYKLIPSYIRGYVVEDNGLPF